MLAAERQGKILELIQKRGSVHVDELAAELQVSDMTIRRDLIKLQNENKIERCHGGAVAKHEVTYADKQTSHKKEKEAIAEMCASMVAEGDVIFLDAGTTTYEIAIRIKDIPSIQIVTNDIEIAHLLLDSQAELYVCGGNVQKSTGSMFDSYSAQMLRDFRFDLGFFGAACINDKYEVMTPTRDKMWMKRQATEQCAESYLAVDGSKFGKEAMTCINRLSDYTGVVTEREFSKEECKKLKALQIQIISTEPKV